MIETNAQLFERRGDPWVADFEAPKIFPDGPRAPAAKPGRKPKPERGTPLKPHGTAFALRFACKAADARIKARARQLMPLRECKTLFAPPKVELSDAQKIDRAVFQARLDRARRAIAQRFPASDDVRAMFAKAERENHFAGPR